MVYGFTQANGSAEPRVKAMHRTATTMLGLAVVAVSIGFNTLRWPIVEQTVASVEPASPEESAAVAPPSEPPAQPAAAQPANPLPTLPTVKPVPDAEKIGGENLPPNRAAPPGDIAAAGENRPPAAIRQERPLVPVPQMRDPIAPAGAAAYDGKVRRLPPVDFGQPTPIVIGQPSPYGAMPVYPTTGIR